MRRAVIVMGKQPRAGEVKTRLIPALGPGAAAGLYRAFLLDVLESVARVPGCEKFLFVHPPDSTAWFAEWLAPTDAAAAVRAQQGATLAERMVAAFAALFREGFGAVVMRNSDSPTLPDRAIERAFAELAGGTDVVLLPDQGGGYCLVGLRAPRPDLFHGVAMGTRSVFEETLRRARLLQLRVEVLPAWLDVDTPEDLERLLVELDPAGRTERAPCERTEAFLATLRLGQRFPRTGAGGGNEGEVDGPPRAVP